MFHSQGMTPPFGPILLAGLAARPLSPRLLQPLLDAIMGVLHRCHPNLFDRLRGLDKSAILIDPTDLPLVFVLQPDPLAPTLTALRDPEGEPVSATVRGPLLSLVDLLEGRNDGDALFFSRDLLVEGNTEVVVALRNAVDDAEIDVIADVTSALGPLARPSERLCRHLRSILDLATRDLETVRASLTSSTAKRHEALAAKVARLDAKLALTNRGGRRRPALKRTEETLS